MAEGGATSGAGKSCNTLCTDWFANCAGNDAGSWGATYQNQGACLQACNALTEAQICCRGYHVTQATGSSANITLHCPHAVGMGNAPAECQ